MNNIPIYRAKKKKSDEYIEGIGIDGNFLVVKTFLLRDGHVPLRNEKDYRYEADYEMIDTSTLSINFPDMLDSQGNKIFASLSEDGKGGDIVNLDEVCGENFNAVALYRYYEIHLKGGIDLLNRAKYLRCYPKKDIKVIGIQE